MRWIMGVCVLIGIGSTARAGLYDSAEKFAELPSAMRGFLLDQRALRTLAIPVRPDSPSSLFRDGYVRRLTLLEEMAEKRELSADELADRGAILVRLGRLDAAIAVLDAAHRQHPRHFRISSNFATASQLRGDLDRAADLLEVAVAVAPEALREVERLHLRLVRLRAREQAQRAAGDALDDLFGLRYEAANARERLPANALALTQALALALPADARLLWQLAEISQLYGDTRTAAAILDGCITELGLSSEPARSRRRQLRAAVDALDMLPEEQQHTSGRMPAKSPRPLLNRLNVELLPKVRPDAINAVPWLVFGETVIERGFRPKFLPYIDQLENKRVRLTGFMQPMGEGPDVAGFLLLEFPIGCWFCESPELVSVVQVQLPAEQSIPIQRGLLKVEGTLTLNRRDPENYLYTLTNAKVSEPD